MSSARAMMVRAFRYLHEQRDVVQDTHGNVSMRQERRVFLKPSGMPYELIHEEDVVECLLDGTGQWSSNSRRPSVDTEQHLNIYRANPDVTSICHTHSPHATAFAIVDEPMEVLCTEHADYFGRPIHVDTFRWGELGFAYAPVLADGEKACLLGKHGVLTFGRGPDPMEAARLAVAIESIARKYLLARQLKPGATRPMRPEDVALWHSRYNTRYGQ